MPLRNLLNFGRVIAQKVHGNRRSSEGYLLVRGHYLLPQQERIVGLCYLGLLAAPIFLASVWYVAVRYGKPVGLGGLPRARFPSYSQMPSEVRILLFIAIGSWLSVFGSIVRLSFLNQVLADQPIEDLADSAENQQYGAATTHCERPFQS